MNVRRLVAAVAALVAVLALVTGGASGDSFEPGPPIEGTPPRLNVTPSDDLPPNSVVDVATLSFFPNGTIPDDFVSFRQCVPSTGECGPETRITFSRTGDAIGTMVLVRFLTVPSTTVDCSKTDSDLLPLCNVSATSGFLSASHHTTFSPLVPTTTAAPTTTRAPATTRPPVKTSSPPATIPSGPTTTVDLRPQPGVTIPPTTRVTGRATTTSVRPTTSTSAPTTTTTLPPPSSDPTTLIAVTSKNQPSGPPGGTLHVEGGGYACPTVYFFFDSARVGSDSPDAAGHVSEGGISVPGDAGKGPHRVTASCEASGTSVLQASSFQVLPVGVHRPAFVTSLPLPGQVSLAPTRLLTSAAVAVGALLLIAFPFELFNSTMEENYDEIRAWFHMGPRDVGEKTRRRRTMTFFAWTAVTAVVCGFLSPDFGLNRTSLVLAVGMFVALLVMAVVFSLPADIGIHRQFGEWGKLNFLPGSVVVSIVLVGLSRLFDFQPGYFYGALAGLAFRSALSEPVQGRMTAANWAFSLAVSAGAWFARVPVSAAAGRPGASIWWIGLEICLAMIFLWGVEGLAVAMLPLHFLDGRKVFRWSRLGWAVLFFLGLFATFHVLLSPGSGYVGHTTGGVAIGVMVLYVAFGLGSVLFWAYFRYRPQRWALAGS